MLDERKTTPGARGSTGPPKYAVSERFFSALSLGKISLSATRVGLLTIRPKTGPSSAHTEDGNINTTDSLKIGLSSSGRATRKRVLSSLPPLLGLSCAACTGVLLRTSKRQKAKAALDLSRNFRFGPLTDASHASPALGTTNFPPEQAPARSAVFRRLVFARLTGLACCRVIDFSDTAPTLLPRLQILQPQSECYPLGPLSRRSVMTSV